MKKLFIILFGLLLATTSWATVNITDTRVQYTCNGVTTTYAYAFQIYNDSDLVVTKSNTSDLSESTLVLNVDYTVTGAGGTGGTVELLSGANCGSGYEITITRDVDLLQQLDFVDGEAFSAEDIEDGLDKAMLIAQDQGENIGRSVLLKKSSDLSGLEFPNPTPNKSLCWDESGTALTNCDTASATSTVFDHIGNYASLADAVSDIGSAVTTLVIDEATIIADGTTVTIPSTLSLMVINGGSFDGVAGGGTETLTISGDVKAGLYQVFKSDIAIPDSSLKRAVPEWFGAAGDADAGGGGTDDQVALQKTFDSSLFIELSTNYKVESPIEIADNLQGLIVRGNGSQTSGIFAKDCNAFNISGDIRYTTFQDWRLVNTVRTGASTGFNFTGYPQHLTIERMAFFGFATRTISIAGGLHIRLKDNYFSAPLSTNIIHLYAVDNAVTGQPTTYILDGNYFAFGSASADYPNIYIEDIDTFTSMGDIFENTHTPIIIKSNVKQATRVTLLNPHTEAISGTRFFQAIDCLQVFSTGGTSNWSNQYTLNFNTGTSEIFDNDVVTGETSNSKATAVKVTLDSGTWGGGDAAGTILIDKYRGESFVSGENIQVSAATKAVAGSTVVNGNDQSALGLSQSFGSITGIKGLSTGTVQKSFNLRGSITISDLETSGTWTFLKNEPDAEYFAVASCSGRTGTPAAGSYFLQRLLKEAIRVSAVVDTAPGAGNSVTFDIFIIR